MCGVNPKISLVGVRDKVGCDSHSIINITLSTPKYNIYAGGGVFITYKKHNNIIHQKIYKKNK